jgi:hypothetical protein
MDTDANLHALILGERQIQLQELALDLHGGANGRSGIGKFRHRGIANGLNYFAFESFDGSCGHFIVAMDHHQTGRIPIALKEAGRTHHIRKQHRQGILVPAQLFINLSAGL